MRLKHVLVSLTRHALRLSSDMTTKIAAAYNRDAKLLIVHLTMPGTELEGRQLAQMSKMLGPMDHADGKQNIYSFFSDELRMGLFISKNVVELCGGKLDLIFDSDSNAIKIVFSFHMEEVLQD